MPLNREPRLYQGSVISLIGTTAGQEVMMEYKNAQACVSCGTHRWMDDPTDLSNVLRMEIEQKAISDAAAVEADRLHNLEMRRIREEQEAAALRANLTPFDVAPIHIAQEGDTTYLGRPLPASTSINPAHLDLPYVAFIIEDGEGVQAGDVVITFENALARYRTVATGMASDGVISILELAEDAGPQVDIPANWRELGHLQQIPLAKAIRGVKGGINKAQAIAILEEWTKPNDPVRIEIAVEEVAEGEGKGEITDPRDPNHKEAGNRDAKPFIGQDQDGNAIEVSPEEKARQDAASFAAGDDDDSFGV